VIEEGKMRADPDPQMDLHMEEKEGASMALAHRRPYGIYRWLAHAPDWLYQCGLGWLLGYRLMQITHRGRKSGKLRRTVLEVLHYDPQTREILVVSGWEGKTDWYRNIQQEPALEVRISRVQYRPDQAFLSSEETAQLILTLFRQRPREARLLGPLLGVDPDTDEAHLRARLSTFFRGVRLRPVEES
jgi:deazaflavin-dependent oxidoreductase (nitroreductase family)